MVDGVPVDGGDDRVVLGLVDELGRVDADRHQDVGVVCLERAQLVEDVQAVDAAEGPEVEQDDLAAQVGQREGATPGVEPAARARPAQERAPALPCQCWSPGQSPR